jgi:hypothetical protein
MAGKLATRTSLRRNGMACHALVCKGQAEGASQEACGPCSFAASMMADSVKQGSIFKISYTDKTLQLLNSARSDLAIGCLSTSCA